MSFAHTLSGDDNQLSSHSADLKTIVDSLACYLGDPFVITSIFDVDGLESMIHKWRVEFPVEYAFLPLGFIHGQRVTVVDTQYVQTRGGSSKTCPLIADIIENIRIRFNPSTPATLIMLINLVDRDFVVYRLKTSLVQCYYGGNLKKTTEVEAPGCIEFILSNSNWKVQLIKIFYNQYQTFDRLHISRKKCTVELSKSPSPPEVYRLIMEFEWIQ